MPIIVATHEADIRRTVVLGQPGKIICKTLSQKYPIQKSSGIVTQVIDCLLRKHKSLSSNPSTSKNNNSLKK
jgi:hypothetical protein